MLGEILRGLDIVHRGLVLLDVAAVGPGVDELHDVAITPLGTVYGTEVLFAKAVGQQITIAVNGKTVLDYSLAKLTDGKIAPSGFKIPGHLPRPWSTLRTSGPIGFQGKHGGALPYFRNVRIRTVKYE